jgi:hypothetical protein
MQNDTPEIESILTTIEADAQTAATAHAAQVEASDLEDAAEAKVLRRAIDLARPGLWAASSRIRVAYRNWWPDSTCSEEEYDHAPERGVFLSPDPGPVRVGPRGTRGEYSEVEGDLILLTSGDLVSCHYRGSWSKWQGAESSWTLVNGLLPTTPEQAVRWWRLSTMLGNLAEVLAQQAKAERPTARMLARAERLQALATLAGK